jgi:putative tryptophan/tyrosine transport system substrate-binding protein
MIKRREFIAGLGSAVAWPLAARAQQPSLPVIGYLDPTSADATRLIVAEFRQGLKEAGYVEDQNVAIEFRWANNQPDLLPKLAADLVARRVAVIVASGASSGALAAKAATSTIPIVFFYGGDPVADGLIGALNRPDGNLTGMTNRTAELQGKRLDLLHKMVPRANIIGFLSGTRNYLFYEEQTSSMRAAADALGLRLDIVECETDRDYEQAFSTFDEHHIEALILGPFVLPNLNKVIDLAERHRIPAMYFGRGFVVNGGLMSYDADVLAAYRQLGARYVGPILRGAKPADLPVQQSNKFDLVINLRTAKALGLEVPATLLAIADEVIE